MMTFTLTWAPSPTDDDVNDAERFMTLLDVQGMLEVDPMQTRVLLYPAKDLLRAARLPPLPPDNAGVRKWLSRMRGKQIPPVLLVRGSFTADRPLIIAEGYHRVCACYLHDERCDVACWFLSGEP